MIIFLDIYGVLNHQLWFDSQEYKQLNKESLENHRIADICPRSVGLLNKLTDNTGADIVLSSTWRVHFKTDYDMKEFFKSVGVTGNILGRTPRLNVTQPGSMSAHVSVPRGLEILSWQNQNKEHKDKNYVIFDDDSDMLYWQRNHLFIIDGYCGLTEKTIYKAERFLKGIDR